MKDKLEINLENSEIENKSGLCSKILVDLQRLLACALLNSSDGAARTLTQEKIAGIKTIVSHGSSSARCSLVLRTNLTLKTGLGQWIYFTFHVKCYV